MIDTTKIQNAIDKVINEIGDVEFDLNKLDEYDAIIDKILDIKKEIEEITNR